MPSEKLVTLGWKPTANVKKPAMLVVNPLKAGLPEKGVGFIRCRSMPDGFAIGVSNDGTA
jgi:hypothetical protein